MIIYIIKYKIIYTEYFAHLNCDLATYTLPGVDLLGPQATAHRARHPSSPWSSNETLAWTLWGNHEKASHWVIGPTRSLSPIPRSARMVAQDPTLSSDMPSNPSSWQDWPMISMCSNQIVVGRDWTLEQFDLVFVIQCPLSDIPQQALGAFAFQCLSMDLTKSNCSQNWPPL